MKRPATTYQFLALILILFSVLSLATMTSCTAIKPNVDQVQLPTEPPAKRVTSFSDILSEMGVMSEIYGDSLVKIQCREIEDVTGTSYHTGGEIPRSVTLMVNSALNTIGGRVVYIPYWPEYLYGIKKSGYPTSNQKIVPDIILNGGITEFDRGLAMVDKSRNFDVESQSLTDDPYIPGDTIGLDYEKGEKYGKASIAVDFNLISYEALCGIPKMQATNFINVYKAIKEEELGFTLFGPTIGLRGSVQKVQGRHDALRLLVQFSVIQLVGRYMDLPYWKLLDGAKPDPVIIDTISSNFQRKDQFNRIIMIQEMLILNGYDVPVSGTLENRTQAALTDFNPEWTIDKDTLEASHYLELYYSVPLGKETIKNRNKYRDRLAQLKEKVRLAKLEQEKARQDSTKQINDTNQELVNQPSIDTELEKTLERIMKKLGKKKES